MNALLLPGYSLRNKDWIERVAVALNPHFDKIMTHSYAHWQTGGDMDFEAEQQALAPEVTSLAAGYIIFAKSAGAILAIKSIAAGDLKPAKCVFAGTALGMAKAGGMDIDNWLNQIKCPVLFIQKTGDPAVPFVELEAYAKHINPNFQFEEWPGDNHDYDDLAKLSASIKQFVQAVK